MVAEKPSIAEAIARALSHGRATPRPGGSLKVWEFSAPFLNKGTAQYKVAGVFGHIYGTDFPPQYNSWDNVNPSDLFSAPILKIEEDKKHVTASLQREAHGTDYLVLWLDCDREGENICFEVIQNVEPFMRHSNGQQIYRAHFSSVTPTDIARAMSNLGQPNPNEAAAVDVRQELDLKVGVAFTRFQTRYFQNKYGNLDSAVISYGPCQTPTLGFCVERHDQIQCFTPEPFWTLVPTIQPGTGGPRGATKQAIVTAVDQAIKKVRQAPNDWILTRWKNILPSSFPPKQMTETILDSIPSLNPVYPTTTITPDRAPVHAGFPELPRTESSSYPATFNIRETVEMFNGNPGWRGYAQQVLAGPMRAKEGLDAGDHPPITPTQCATESQLGGGVAWRVYEFVALHFLATVAQDAEVQAPLPLPRDACVSAEGAGWAGLGGQEGRFTSILHWMQRRDEVLPDFRQGQHVTVTSVELREGRTSPPDYLTESELITLMEKHGIGTDASIPMHINNIITRNYVRVQPPDPPCRPSNIIINKLIAHRYIRADLPPDPPSPPQPPARLALNGSRQLVPTELGVVLAHGYHRIDSDLVLPAVRSEIEKQISLIATGRAGKEAVLAHSLSCFKAKFDYFAQCIGLMDTLFESTFTTLAQSGKPLSRCGKCHRYMNLISTRPARLFCPTCDESYNMPGEGTIKLYKEIRCPLDGFELVVCSRGSDQKAYPLCPLCYNHPPAFAGDDHLERADQGPAGQMHLNCTQCGHPTCPQACAQTMLGPCINDQCTGCLILDTSSGPHWRIASTTSRPQDRKAPLVLFRKALLTDVLFWAADCNVCPVMIHVAPGAHRVALAGTRPKKEKDEPQIEEDPEGPKYCEKCGEYRLLDVTFHRDAVPGGRPFVRGCIQCDPELHDQCQYSESRARHEMDEEGDGTENYQGRKIFNPYA
ncbi:putative DNA topoisomerase 3-beta-1 [Paratrimastix pyriformis]|uniref:DNA topoisomerase n=1 Tax=Paratrimastix pyriformis TaxID=342808 RepID=A0ABQ8UNE0_9EUKA|nr:putative DNA topoisomerase 3-beta-1 [Paratrimastix pyriformis]